VTDSERQASKQVVYGIIYGIGTASLARQLGVSEEEADRLMTSFVDKYPGIKRFMRSQVDGVRESGKVVTLSGRCRQLPGINSDSVSDRGQAERQAVHTAVQGTVVSCSPFP
jgi:DNA polymerase I-like protein with 3'-5' exonuclease and polymerase domains